MRRLRNQDTGEAVVEVDLGDGVSLLPALRPADTNLQVVGLTPIPERPCILRTKISGSNAQVVVNRAHLLAIKMFGFTDQSQYDIVLDSPYITIGEWADTDGDGKEDARGIKVMTYANIYGFTSTVPNFTPQEKDPNGL